MTASVVCFAPHLIDYTAYAIAQRADGSVVIAGQARDRWHGTPYKFYGARAVVQVTGGSAREQRLRHLERLGRDRASRSAPPASSIDGLGARRHAARRQPRRAHLPRRRRARRRLVRDRGDQRRRSRASPPPAPSTRRFGTGGTTTIPTAALHAVRVLPDGSVLAAGEGTGAATARRLLVAKLGPAGTRRPASAPPASCACSRARATTQGQALALQSDGRILIAGGAVTTRQRVVLRRRAPHARPGCPTRPGRPAAPSRRRSAQPATPRRSSRRRAASSSPAGAPTPRSATPTSTSSSRATSAARRP